MDAVTAADLQSNAQAVEIARAVLGEAVEAACRCEQVTRDQKLAARGASSWNRRLLKWSELSGDAVVKEAKKMRTAGLPDSFLLVVTATEIYALEDRRDGPNLVAGRVLTSWDREGFVAKQSSDPLAWSMNGVPEDRLMATLYLPIEGRTDYSQAAARNLAAGGVNPAMPHRMAFANDAASRTVLDAIATKGAATTASGEPAGPPEESSS